MKINHVKQEQDTHGLHNISVHCIKTRIYVVVCARPRRNGRAGEAFYVCPQCIGTTK